MKYYGVVILILGVVFTLLNREKIEENNKVIDDYVTSEIANGERYLNSLRSLNKKYKVKDTTTIHLDALYQSVLKNDSYHKPTQIQLGSHIHTIKDYQSKRPTITLFNQMVAEALSQQHKTRNQGKDSLALFVAKLERLKGDSIELKIVPLLIVNNQEDVQYSLNDVMITHDALQNYDETLMSLVVRSFSKETRVAKIYLREGYE